MAKNSERKVIVLDPNGKEHKMTPLNARDVINHAGWTIKTPAKPKPQIGAVEDIEDDDEDDVEEEQLTQNVDPDDDDEDDDGEQAPADEDGGDQQSGDGDDAEDEPEALAERSKDEWQEELAKLSRDELHAFAKKHFNVQLDNRKGDANLRRDVYELITA